MGNEWVNRFHILLTFPSHMPFLSSENFLHLRTSDLKTLVANVGLGAWWCLFAELFPVASSYRAVRNPSVLKGLVCWVPRKQGRGCTLIALSSGQWLLVTEVLFSMFRVLRRWVGSGVLTGHARRSLECLGKPFAAKGWRFPGGINHQARCCSAYSSLCHLPRLPSSLCASHPPILPQFLTPCAMPIL